MTPRCRGIVLDFIVKEKESIMVSKIFGLVKQADSFALKREKIVS